jgi:hypothetical protein
MDNREKEQRVLRDIQELEQKERKLRDDYILSFESTFVVTGNATIQCRLTDHEKINSFIRTWTLFFQKHGVKLNQMSFLCHEFGETSNVLTNKKHALELYSVSFYVYLLCCSENTREPNHALMNTIKLEMS